MEQSPPKQWCCTYSTKRMCINWALSVEELRVYLLHSYMDKEADKEFIEQEIVCEDGINQNLINEQ